MPTKLEKDEVSGVQQMVWMHSLEVILASTDLAEAAMPFSPLQNTKQNDSGIFTAGPAEHN
jgi:hypothetical protein